MNLGLQFCPDAIHPLGMFGTCSGSLSDLFRTRLGPLWDMFGITLGLLWDMFGVTSGHVRGHFETCLGSRWNYVATCVGHVLDLFGSPLEHFWHDFQKHISGDFRGQDLRRIIGVRGDFCVFVVFSCLCFGVVFA